MVKKEKWKKKKKKKKRKKHVQESQTSHLVSVFLLLLFDFRLEVRQQLLLVLPRACSRDRAPHELAESLRALELLRIHVQNIYIYIYIYISSFSIYQSQSHISLLDASRFYD
jgi:hypothetical protein